MLSQIRLIPPYPDSDPVLQSSIFCSQSGSSTVPQEQIRNCRCTLLSWVKGFEGDTVKSSPKMGDMSFEEWQKAKPIPDTAANRAQFDEYTKLLGKDAPKYYNDFQKLKYNDPKAWEKLKEEAKMERVIRNAPCQLTKRKFFSYLLKEGAKHAEKFFAVGYKPSDVRLLRYDMARQFNLANAIDSSTGINGARKFNILMELGVTKKRWFLTGWQYDKDSETPRFLTAFRQGKKK